MDDLGLSARAQLDPINDIIDILQHYKGALPGSLKLRRETLLTLRAEQPDWVPSTVTHLPNSCIVLSFHSVAGQL